MTIRFNCPYCDALIAFDDKHCGKRARCFSCGQLFIIPSQDNEKAKKVELKPERADPLPGFYRAVFIDNLKLFISPENTSTLVFVIAVICFKFFLGTGVCCCNYISFFVVWGWLFGFYLNIIYETAYDIDKLPEIYLGTSITFLWYIIKPIFIFIWTLLLVETPFFIALAALGGKGLTFDNMWQADTQWRFLLQLMYILGLCLFPAAIIAIAVGKDISLLRPGYLFAPIVRAFGPYLVVSGLVIAAGVLEMQTSQYTTAGIVTSSIELLLNLAVQVIAIIAMRSIGLFYRHYSCYFKW